MYGMLRTEAWNERDLLRLGYLWLIDAHQKALRSWEWGGGELGFSCVRDTWDFNLDFSPFLS